MSKAYIPPKVWVNKAQGPNQWESINSPVSGPRYQQSLPQGEHPLQLYSLATPNGQKVTILLEELLALGIKEAEYDAFLIKIGQGEQFSSGFVQINPNSKIPALVDQSVNPPIYLFESASILVYLAEKFNQFLPSGGEDRAKVFNWLFWAQGSAPYLGGGFGHFYTYAQEKQKYPIDRFTMEVKRQLDVLDKHLANNLFVGGKTYSIADIAIWPWYGNLVLGKLYDSAEFLQVHTYENIIRWAKQIGAREAVKRGKIVNRFEGNPWETLPQRHSSEDIDQVLQLSP